MKLAFLTLLMIALPETAALADPKLDALLAAYPDRLASYTDDELVWKDGTRMPLGSAGARHPFAEMLERGSIREQFAIPYPLATAPFRPPATDEDPGRIRNEAFFLKMYGDCRRGEVTAKLRSVAWLPRHGGGTVRATTVNGVADQLEKVSRELDALPQDMIRYLIPTSGIYNCRPIAGTNRLSVHAFGAAIDINAGFGDYWQWTKRPEGALVWRNRIPREIVEIFERHGFIWGGRWYHFDSLHFEYRPELIALAKRGWPRE
ncbi:M15 family metallopeptidase [Bradyrhizobium sp.]|uniref:M15 family metallopeptidase n=1 Tax=Bradyrhizobium sp. TaxID=376 RepID=UPI001DD8A400|nr:M15 family metallopeptidase [Bradyrhizobium sp.]MBI5321696.1 M15 family metallopeptidase [Bradyrhizobium sp.]